MKFYFCEKYINTEADEKEVEKDMYQLSRIFGVLMIMMGMQSEKTNLKIFFRYFYLTLEKKRQMPK